MPIEAGRLSVRLQLSGLGLVGEVYKDNYKWFGFLCYYLGSSPHVVAVIKFFCNLVLEELEPINRAVQSIIIMIGYYVYNHL